MIEDNQQDTICAISTAPGAGGVALIRVSGTAAISICDKLFVPHRAGKSLLTQQAYTVSYGCMQSVEGEAIDDVLVSIFRSPHSFTGEDTVEIACHGSIYIQQRLLQLLVETGCRLAKPGEFTQRAFMHGKMDLSQAEAVADLIASTSRGQHRLALQQMRGGFGEELRTLREQLLHITSLIELELDFSDHEELEFADREELKNLANKIEQVIGRLAASFRVGNAIKNGIPVAIVGETNVGKSTLLNALLNEEKAIVSDIHGTTRDVIEDTLVLQGILFRFIDTAGIRETNDTIEHLGIERTYQKIDQASIVLWLIDATHPETAALANEVLPLCKNKKLIVVVNKTDLLTTSPTLPSNLPQEVPVISLSAKNKEKIDTLQERLVELAGLPELSEQDTIVTNVRHYEALTHALEAIRSVQTGMAEGLSGDFIAQDLRECIYHLCDIVGEVTTDQVLGNIFSHFCIGK